MRRKHILVADPLPLFRAGVRNLLVREGSFVVSEAGALDEMLGLVARSSPDMALVDLNLPPQGGIAAVTELKRRTSCDVIVWSFDVRRDSIFAAIAAGASGYLHKEISPPGLLRSLTGISRNEAPLPRDLAALLIDAVHGLEERTRAREQAGTLSSREREVLRLIAQGARNKEIAAELFISEFTVKRHVQNILQKLGLSARGAAAAFYQSAFGRDGFPSLEEVPPLRPAARRPGRDAVTAQALRSDL
jgi:two-component system NarL family response regulator